MVTWTEIQSRRWSREQQAIINDIADLEVRTLDFLQSVKTGEALTSELEELIKEYKERILLL